MMIKIEKLKTKRDDKMQADCVPKYLAEKLCLGQFRIY